MEAKKGLQYHGGSKQRHEMAAAAALRSAIGNSKQKQHPRSQQQQCHWWPTELPAELRAGQVDREMSG